MGKSTEAVGGCGKRREIPRLGRLEAGALRRQLSRRKVCRDGTLLEAVAALRKPLQRFERPLRLLVRPGAAQKLALLVAYSR